MPAPTPRSSWPCALSLGLSLPVATRTPALPERQVPCPSCRRLAPYGERNPWRPFCSQRCRSADLGAWASERFRVPVPPTADEDDDAGAAP
ncbi:MAG: DNA gyrase inhibitor YacG [Burkholderiales bacterium]|nr:DNA gyrase inhibitor YacG [Burkholderiales bacterium]MDE2276278.1 DNA gyrase inhibitor YacG [Burkholderiales bacterium]